MKPVRKAVFPVAGLGTRFLPATKAMPKEMLTVVDRPLIQYAVEEALAVLGLAEGASEDDIKAAHRRLIQRMHPDVGGTADLAARINRAKDVLLGG